LAGVVVVTTTGTLAVFEIEIPSTVVAEPPGAGLTGNVLR